MLLCAATPQSALVGASVPPSRVAVVGGGLAGLATAFHLLNVSAPLDALHVYDACAPGTGGASAAAAGLLHPFTRTGGEIWRGRDGFAATCALLRACEAHASSPFCTASGLLRLARAARPLARPILGYPGSKPTPRFNLGPRNRRAAPPVTHFWRSREY